MKIKLYGGPQDGREVEGIEHGEVVTALRGLYDVDGLPLGFVIDVYTEKEPGAFHWQPDNECRKNYT